MNKRKKEHKKSGWGKKERKELEHVVCVRALSHHQEKVEAARGCRRAGGHVVREDVPDRLDRAAPAVAPREERQEECRPPQASRGVERRRRDLVRHRTQGRALIVDVDRSVDTSITIMHIA